MRKIPVLVAVVASAGTLGIVLAGPATAVDSSDLAMCAHKSKTYIQFQKCADDASKRPKEGSRSLFDICTGAAQYSDDSVVGLPVAGPEGVLVDGSVHLINSDPCDET
ncbi:hypothetical protein [Nocardia sp. NPDC050175]|uniref:hypothetical protein n=1 Tax=Nocardia sp. NPDC050175 TaxID=3364317 RepID=UPI00379472BC